MGEAQVQGPAQGHNRLKRLEAQLADWKQRAEVAEGSLERWRERALQAEADAEAAHAALDDLLEAFEDV